MARANSEQRNVNLNRKKGKGGDKFRWDDGKLHSRPQRSPQQLAKAVRKKNQAAQQQAQSTAMNSPAAFTAPLSYGQALQEGGRVADLTYGPQIAQVQLQQRQTPAWFDQYRASLLTPQQVQAQYQPTIQAVQQNAAQTAQATPGLDPNSQAGQADAAAAKAREALVNLGAATLGAQSQADTTYYQGRQGVANAAQQGVNAQLSSQLGSLQGQRGAAVAQYVGEQRQNERQYGLNQQHQAVENAAFGVKAQEAQTKAQIDRAKIRQTAKQNRQKAREKGQEVNKYGYTNEQWGRFSPSHRQRIMRQQDSTGGAQAKPKFTPEQTSKANIGLRKAVALIQGKLAGKQDAPDTFWKQAYQALVSEKDLDPAVARAAIQLVRLGRVGPNTRQTLKNDYGITRFPKGSKRKKPPAYVRPDTPTAPDGSGGSRKT